MKLISGETRKKFSRETRTRPFLAFDAAQTQAVVTSQRDRTPLRWPGQGPLDRPRSVKDKANNHLGDLGHHFPFLV